VVADLTRILLAAKPEYVYLHNLADKHDTHVSVTLRALRLCARCRRKRPAAPRVRLRSVARSRLADGRRQADAAGFGAQQHRRVAGGVFDSQVTGGKRYDLATAGRRLACARTLRAAARPTTAAN
jgi:hypothetical protein